MNLSKVNLQDVPNIPIGTLSKMSPEQLLSLQEQALQHLQRAKMLKDWLDNTTAPTHDIRRPDNPNYGKEICQGQNTVGSQKVKRPPQSIKMNRSAPKGIRDEWDSGPTADS
jgi:hypothetical protein